MNLSLSGLTTYTTRRDITLSKGNSIDHGYELIARSAPVLEQASSSIRRRFVIAAVVGWAEEMVGHHTAADRLLRRALALREVIKGKDFQALAHNRVEVAHNLVMMGHSKQAELFLKESAKSSKVDFHGSWADYYRYVERYELARTRLEQGDARAALVLLPSPGAVPLPQLDEDTSYAFGAIRGESLCAAGSHEEGLDELETWIRRMLQSGVSTRDPGVARVRAIAGLCAYAIGQPLRALDSARLAREAFAVQGDLSPWFKEPYVALERKLAASRKDRHRIHSTMYQRRSSR